jgi:hypothetical protein
MTNLTLQDQEINQKTEPSSLITRIFEIIDVLELGLGLAFIFFIYNVAFIGYYFLFSPSHESINWFLIIEGIFAIFISPFFYSMWKAMKTLSSWRNGYLAYAYLNFVEFMPRQGEDVLKDLANRLLKIYPINKKTIIKDRNIIEYNVTVDGKKGEHDFQVEISTKGNRLVLVKLFDINHGVVNEKDIQILKEELNDIIKIDDSTNQLIILSYSGFDENVLDFLENKDNIKMVKKVTFAPVLIEVSNNAYSIRWMPFNRIAESPKKQD